MRKNIMASERLKIGFVIDDGLDKADGVQQSVLTLGQWLVEKGHQVFYIAGETKNKSIPGVYSVSKNLKVRFNGNFLKTPLPAPKKRINQILAKEKPDVLYVQMPYSPFLAARVVRQAPKDTVVVGTFHILPYDLLTKYGTRLLGLYLKRNLKRFDRHFCVSEPTKKFAKYSFGISCEVLNNPVNIAEFAPKTPRPQKKDKTVNIVFLGRLTPRKGCLQLLKALRILKSDHSVHNFKLDVCGDGYLRKDLEKFVSDNDLEDYVEFHGYVSQQEKIEYLQTADIAVFPSISGESFGIVLLEAMAAKARVVLAGDNPGYRSVLQDSQECLFVPNDIKSLADMLRFFIEDKKTRDNVHKKQQEIIRNYDINVIGEKFLSHAIDCKNYKNKK